MRLSGIRVARLGWLRPLGPAALAVTGALVVGALVLVVTGHDPVDAYAALAGGALGGRGGANLVSTLGRSVPVIGMGLAAALAFRAGFFNLGGEGQLVLGGLAAAITGLYLPGPAPLVVLATLAAGAAAGAIWAGLAAFSELRCGVSLLVASLLLNYPAKLFASYLVTHPLRDVASGMSQTHRLPPDVTLPRLGSSRVHLGLLLVLALVLAAGWMLRRTRFGYHLRLTGLNSSMARYGGVEVSGVGYRVMLGSGAVAGTVGAVQVLAVHQRFIDGSLTEPLYAWTGIMVALLAASRPLGVLLAGFFLAALQTGGFGMERATDVPRELSQVLQALVILLVAARSRFPFAARRSGELEG